MFSGKNIDKSGTYVGVPAKLKSKNNCMESNMSKKILILANNSIGLYKFRVDLIKN